MTFEMNILTWSICAVIAAILTMIGSKWIDSLYSNEDAPLSFPDEIERRRRFRKPILAAALFGCTLNFSTVPLPLNVYLMTAVFFLLLMTFTDFEQHVIFDRMTLPFAVIGLIAVLHLQLPLAKHVGSALVGGGAFLLLAVVTHGALGGGDIKLIAALGIWLGYPHLSNVIAAGCISGGIAALIMLITKQKNRKSYFAYGPYFALTAILILMYFKNLS